MSDSTVQLADTMAQVAFKLGFTVTLINMDDPFSFLKLLLTIAKLFSVAMIFKGKAVVLSLYPLVVPLSWRRRDLMRLFYTCIIANIFKIANGVIYVFDLPIEQALFTGGKSKLNNSLIQQENIFIRSCKHVLAFNGAMITVLSKRYGIPNSRFFTYDLLDYYSEFKGTKDIPATDKLEIAYIAGNLNTYDTKSIITRLPFDKNITYHFYGREGGYLKSMRSDIIYEGFKANQMELLKSISRHSFGLINYSPETAPYLIFGSTSRFSAYLAAGLPLLVQSDLSHPAYLVERYDIGLIYRRLEDLPKLVKGSLSPERYCELKRNAHALSIKIRNGYFASNAILNVLRRLLQEQK